MCLKCRVIDIRSAYNEIYLVDLQNCRKEEKKKLFRLDAFNHAFQIFYSFLKDGCFLS